MRRLDASVVGARLVSAFVLLLLFLGSLLTLLFLRHRGVTLSGDEPSYVMAAFAIGHLHTVYLAATTHTSFAHVVFAHSAVSEETVARHGVTFPYHAVGFSALLAIPFVVVQAVLADQVTLTLILAILTTWLCREVVALSGSTSKWSMTAGLLFLSPAYLLATTQIYPDLVSGVILALVVIRLARLEGVGRQTLGGLTLTGLLVGAFAWLDDKNIVIAIVVALALVLIARRSTFDRRRASALLIPSLLGIVSVVAFNVYAYGHPLGPLQPIDPLSISGVTRAVSLLFDRRHGLVVQSPWVLLGFVGLGFLWRRCPISSSVAIVASAATLLGNASLTGGMSGGSFVGRYEWEVLPLSLALAAFVILRLLKSRVRLGVAVIGAVAASAVFEATALIADRASASSFSSTGWDPATYVGWWGRLDPSPVLNYFDGEWSNARNLWGLTCVVGGATVVVLAVTMAVGRRRSWLRNLIVALVAVIVLAWIMALRSPFMLPPPFRFAASDLGRLPHPVPSTSVVVRGEASRGTILSGPDVEVLPGRYHVVFRYTLVDSVPNVLVAHAYVSSGSGFGRLVASTVLNATESHSESLAVTVRHSGRLNVKVNWSGSGYVRVDSVTVEKIATCNVVDCVGGIA